MEKKGDSLTFDMADTSPQAPGFINCTMSGLRGAVMTGLLPILAPGIRWNEGVMRPVTITAPEACLCNAAWPAPVSAATVSAAWVVQNVVVAALSRLVAMTPETIREGQAVTKGHMMVMTLAGRDRDGSPFGTFLLDSTAGGGGAFIDHDGLDGSGDYVVPRPCIANVEANESAGPYLYLFRAFVPDSGGPGRMRGGAGTALAITPHDTDGLHAMIVGHGVEVPNAIGQFGGLPGSCGRNFLKRGMGSVSEILAKGSSLAALDGQCLYELGPKPGHIPLGRGDVVGYSFQGGGGYGDPLRRPAARVAADVRNRHVSVEAARAMYGTVLKDGEVDEAATAARRLEIRTERLGMRPNVAAPEDVKPDAALNDLRIKAGRFGCACGHDLGPASQNWKDNARTRVLGPTDNGPMIRLHPDLEIRQFVCRSCGMLLETEVVRSDQASLQTIALAG